MRLPKFALQVELIRSNMANPNRKNVGGQTRLEILAKVNQGELERVGGKGLGGARLFGLM